MKSASYRQFLDANGRLRVCYRDSLAVFAACSDAKSQIVSHPVNIGQYLGTIAAEGGSPHRHSYLTVLDQITFLHIKDKITIGGVDLPAPHFSDQ